MLRTVETIRDKAAGFYERYWQRQLKPAHDILLELAELHSGESVLETACGTGLVTFRAARAVGPEGLVLGTDISESMVHQAVEIARERGLANAQFQRMDAEELTLPDISFDIALCALGLLYLPDPLRGLTEMWRALKPGGRAVAAVWGHRDRCGWAEIFPIVEKRVKTDVCPLFFQLGTGEVLAKTFEMAGFQHIATKRINITLGYATAEEACGAAFAGGPVALAHSRFDDQTRQQAYHDYLVSINGYANESGYEIPGEFVIVRGDKPAR